MKINYTHWNVKEFGNVLVLGIVLVILISVFHMFVSPILTTVLPTVFVTKLTVTDTLLFIMLVRLFTHK